MFWKREEKRVASSPWRNKIGLIFFQLKEKTWNHQVLKKSKKKVHILRKITKIGLILILA